ncbi:MAG: hypothetical protein NHB15_06310 [Methanosarcina barkeri]|nr:hypothetical protein [Methanosarcina sp. ERenArc_MAG2]
MNYKTVICVVSLIMIIAGLGCISQPDSTQPADTDNETNGNSRDIEGLWMGSLEGPGGLEVRILFNISARPDSSINATMDSLDQGVAGIPVETVTYKDDNLRLEVKSIRGFLKGHLKRTVKPSKGNGHRQDRFFHLCLIILKKRLICEENRTL